MAREAYLVDPKQLKVHLTTTGFVSIETDRHSPDEQQAMFGTNGVNPPRSIALLLDNLLDDVSAAPDGADAAELRSMANDLRDSLAKVENFIARLTN